MTVSITAQAAALGLCLALGTGVGLFYDLLRRLRLSLPWQGLQGALDLLFWLGACGALFFCGIVLGDGHIRLYMALCLAAGAAVYFLLWSPLARRGLDGAAWCLGRVGRLLWAPFRGLFHVLAAPFIKIFRRVQKRGKNAFLFPGCGVKYIVSFIKVAIGSPSEHKGRRRPPMLRAKKVGLLVKIALLILLAYLIITLVNVRQQIGDAHAAIETLTEQVNDQTQANTELSNAIENRNDPSYLEDVARERLGLVAPNDRVFYIAD